MDCTFTLITSERFAQKQAFWNLVFFCDLESEAVYNSTSTREHCASRNKKKTFRQTTPTKLFGKDLKIFLSRNEKMLLHSPLQSLSSHGVSWPRWPRVFAVCQPAPRYPWCARSTGAATPEDCPSEEHETPTSTRRISNGQIYTYLVTSIRHQRR